jgi:hypothetical protein
VFYTFLKRCHDYPAGLGIFTGGELLIFFLFQVFLHNIYFILFYIFLSLLCVPSDIPSQAICRSSFSVKPELVTAKKENCVHTRTQTVPIPLFFPSGLVQQQKSWGQ